MKDTGIRPPVGQVVHQEVRGRLSAGGFYAQSDTCMFLKLHPQLITEGCLLVPEKINMQMVIEYIVLCKKPSNICIFQPVLSLEVCEVCTTGKTKASGKNKPKG